MNKTTRLKKPQIPELETLYTFDELGGRPKYGGVEMTSETDIPSFQEIMDETHSAVVAEATARDDADEELQAQIDAEVIAREAAESQLGDDLAAETAAREAAEATLQGNIDAEATARESADTVLSGDISTEASARATKDADLQSQVDAIVASSDVKDIVGSKAELDAYDTSTLGDQDIIKVLQDESQSNATTYYRWSASTPAFSLIGSEGPYYTKTQADTLLGTKADKATTYTKTEVNNALNLKADKSTTYTKTEVDTELAKKGNTVLTHENSVYSLDEGRGVSLDAIQQSGATRFAAEIKNDGSEAILYIDDAYPIISVPSVNRLIDVEDVVYNLNNDISYLNTQISTTNNKIGNLSNLHTTAKNNLVAAINEVAEAGGKVVYVLTPPNEPSDEYELWDISGGQYVPADMGELSDALMAGKTITLVSVDNDDPGDMGIVAILQSAIHSSRGSAEITFCDTYSNENWNFDYNGKWLGRTPVAESPTVVQTIGASQTDVMSQNAVSRLIYPVDGNVAKIAIGGSSSASGNQGTAVGFAAKALNQSSLALGTASTASHSYSVAFPASTTANAGEIAVGLNYNNGYNNSNYRLLTGLYDPQTDHDAATKGYVDTAVASAGAEEINSTDWSNLWQ